MKRHPRVQRGSRPGHSNSGGRPGQYRRSPPPPVADAPAAANPATDPATLDRFASHLEAEMLAYALELRGFTAQLHKSPFGYEVRVAASLLKEARVARDAARRSLYTTPPGMTYERRCGACSYSLVGVAVPERCPECGHDLHTPAPAPRRWWRFASMHQGLLLAVFFGAAIALAALASVL